jgi:hypothetical protein
MAGAPKISCEDIRLHLNGTYTGSADSYYFWEQAISSGSLWSLISGSDVYLRNVCGESIWDSTGADTTNNVKYCELNYACFKALVALSGGVIVDGFNWATGPIRVDTNVMLPAWKNLIEEFKQSSMNFLKNIQTFSLHYETDAPVIGETATAVM